MYTTTSLTASVPLEGIFSSPSPAQYLSSTTTSTGSINVIAGDRICMVLNSSLVGTPPALDEVSFSAGISQYLNRFFILLSYVILNNIIQS